MRKFAPSVGATNDVAKPIDPALRGYHFVYRVNEINHCPGCGRSHWYIGRLLAECAFCCTAIPLPACSTGNRARIAAAQRREA